VRPPRTRLTENPLDRRSGPKTRELIEIPEAALVVALVVTFWHPMMVRPSLMPATPLATLFTSLASTLILVQIHPLDGEKTLLN
jgi:hypothetical protein